MSDHEHLVDHPLLLLLAPRFHRRTEAVVEVLFHELRMRGAEHPHHGEILLHDVDAIRIAFHHLLNPFEQALGLAIAGQ